MQDRTIPSFESPTRLVYICTMPPPEGGVRVLIRILAEGLEQDARIDLTLFDLTVGRNPLVRTLIYLRMMFQIFREMKRCDVVVFSAPSGVYTITLGVAVYSMARLRHKPVVFRHFGGGNADRHSTSTLHRFIVERTILKADLLFYETKYDVDFFRALRKRPVEWFSNNRPVPAVPKRNFNETAKKFIYLGWVNEEKGIKVLIDAVSTLDADIRVDIYGSDLMNVASLLPSDGAVRYLGPVDNSSVYDTLSEYDALILPSFREGYPGVIIEAFLVGLPVIATRLPGICEIVEDEVTGCLVDPRDEEQLAAAIARLNADADLYAALVSGVRENSYRFSSEYWNERFVSGVEDLVARSRNLRIP